MKFTLALFGVLAISGLSKAAHQFPDFGRGPLHEDIQDLLDLIPVEKVSEIVLDYVDNDSEVQEIVEIILTTDIAQKLVKGIESIPECINLLNYLYKEGIEIYDVLNKLNNLLDIDELVPPPRSAPHSSILRTGGLAGLLKDIEAEFNYKTVIRTYVRKAKTSTAFSNLIIQLQSNNFQQLVNKLYTIEAYVSIINGLKNKGADTQIVADVLYILFEITTPNDPDRHSNRAVENMIEQFGVLFRKGHLLH